MIEDFAERGEAAIEARHGLARTPRKESQQIGQHQQNCHDTRDSEAHKNRPAAIGKREMDREPKHETCTNDVMAMKEARRCDGESEQRAPPFFQRAQILPNEQRAEKTCRRVIAALPRMQQKGNARHEDQTRKSRHTQIAADLERKRMT